MVARALVYDATCRFCTANVQRLRRLAGDLALLPSQSPAARELLPRLGESDFAAQLYLVDGVRHYGGAEAVARTLMFNPWLRPLAVAYYLPGVRQLCDRVYAAIARRRHCLGGRCELPPPPARP